MKYKSVFELIGPIMVGPSSSHTAGAVRIGQIARNIFGKEPQKAQIHFYGSFAQTYKGHATDVATVGGILGFETSDNRIPDSLSIAKEKGIDIEFFKEEAIPKHPNTVKIELFNEQEKLEIVGISIGGGSVQIVELNGFDLKLSGENPSLLIYHKDVYGVIAQVASLLAQNMINIGQMNVSRIEKNGTALMIIETDQNVAQEIIESISSMKNITKVLILN